jgi:hypothetical protein
VTEAYDNILQCIKVGALKVDMMTRVPMMQFLHQAHAWLKRIHDDHDLTEFDSYDNLFKFLQQSFQTAARVDFAIDLPLVHALRRIREFPKHSSLLDIKYFLPSDAQFMLQKSAFAESIKKYCSRHQLKEGTLDEVIDHLWDAYGPNEVPYIDLDPFVPYDIECMFRKYFWAV